jgi:catalase
VALFAKIDPAYAEGVKKALPKPAPVSETALP